MNLGHCPVCWDGYDVCKCSQGELDKFYDNIRKEQIKNKEEERKRYHEWLDLCFDRISAFEPSFDVYFFKEVGKNLTRKNWLELRRQFDNYFKVL